MSDTRYDTPEPFKVDIPERALIDLDERLRRWRAPVAIADNGSWASGTDPDFLAELVDYWRHGYDWNRCQEAINRWPNYLVDIGPQRLHFIREPGTEVEGAPRPMPLVVTHGWPGSIVEFLHIIDALAHPENARRRSARRLRRHRALAPRLRLLRPADPRGRQHRPDRSARHRRPVAQARARDAELPSALRRAGRRLGRRGVVVGRLRPSREGREGRLEVGRGRPAPQHDGAPARHRPAQGRAQRRREGLARQGPGRARREDRLPAHPGDQAADPGRGAHRFARRPRRLDRREVPGLERLRRRSAETLLDGPAARQHHGLLADRHGGHGDLALSRRHRAAEPRPAGGPARRDADGLRRLPGRPRSAAAQGMASSAPSTCAATP